jgi:hypothetical protein
MTAGLPAGRTRSADSEGDDQWKAQPSNVHVTWGVSGVLEGNMGEAEVILLVRWGLRTFQLGCEWHEWMCLRREHLNHSLPTASSTPRRSFQLRWAPSCVVQMWTE